MRPENFARLRGLLHERSGLALGQEKMYLVRARLAPILAAHHGRFDLNSLVQAVCAAPGSALATEVTEAMTTNETLFFRDGRPFADLAEQVLPRLHASRPAGARLRIWSAATSFGQEAYSIAIVLHETASVLRDRQVEILGTDIAGFAVARARLGLYSDFEVQRGLTVARRSAHFAPAAGQWQASRRLLAAAEFRQLNLLSDVRSLGQFDVIFCRNVLIYFDRPTKERVVRALSRQLAPDGVLYVGGSENLLGSDLGLTKLPDGSGYGLAAHNESVIAVLGS